MLLRVAMMILVLFVPFGIVVIQTEPRLLRQDLPVRSRRNSRDPRQSTLASVGLRWNRDGTSEPAPHCSLQIATGMRLRVANQGLGCGS